MPTLLNRGALCDNITLNYCVHFVCTLPLAEIYGIVHIKQQIISKGKDDKKMNKAQSKSKLTKVLSLILALVMVLSLMPLMGAASTKDTVDGYKYNIMFLDCGRKYFSVDSIKTFINEASAAGFNYIQLAVGNDGMRFLLDDMSLTVNGTTYTSKQVSDAIHSGNESYYNFDTDELTQSEMDTIIAYANEKGMGVIPCINTPGHMDAILSAATSLTQTTCSYDGSTRTIDVTNDKAVAFTQAFLQKYIVYFASKGCTLFNMGADEYANDKYTSGSMGFGHLQDENQYSYYVTYVNAVAKMIKDAGMTPMAFNDGIYFNNVTKSGTFDTDILICYWSNGWSGYTPMPAATLVSMGYKLINTHGSYYWVLGKSDCQCSASTANGFDYKTFQGGTVSNPAGSMFCIWCDYPNVGTEASVISSTSATIAAFGATLPAGEEISIVPPSTVYNTKGNNTADDADTIKVTAKDLDGLTVSATSVTITNAETDKIAAYDITPSIEGKKYENSATVSIKIPDGWDSSKVRAFVQETGGTITTIIGTSDNDGFYTFTAPHFSVMGLYQLASTAYTSEKEITLTVGGTATDFQEGVNTEGTYETNIATAMAVYADASSKIERTRSNTSTTFSKKNTSVSVNKVLLSDGTNYMVVNSNGSISNTTDINEATPFDVVYKSGKVTIYCSEIKQYLNITSNYTLEMGSSENLNYSTSSNYFYCSSDSSSGSGSNRHKIAFVDGSWQVTTRTNTSEYARLYTYTEETVSTKAGTTVTFTGISEDYTEIQVGSVLYKIKVEDKVPTDAMTGTSITLEHWITNAKVANESEGSTYTTTISSSDASGDEGIEIATKAFDPAYSNFDGWKNVYYWQAMRLDSDNQQTTDNGDDETADGTVLTHVRYHNSAWQYKTTDGVWHYFLSDDQFVAYYLQKIEVTNQIETYTKDWGFKTSDISANSDKTGQVALTIAVVYPDGTVSPTEENMYANSTSIFNFWTGGRDIGIIVPKNNSDYAISKITITNGTRSRAASSSTSADDTWKSTDAITWNTITKADGTTKWYDETVVWDKVNNAGTDPVVNGKDSKIDKTVRIWSAKNEAKLVLIYLEPVEKSTNLNVVWYDDNAKTNIFKSQIVMKYNQGDSEPTFTTALMNASGTCIGATSSWSSNVKDNENYLPDNAYVVNSTGDKQTINKSLSNISGISGIYTSGLYEYVSADISSDGKTLTLHYNLKASTYKVYVVDFGLPVEIPASAFDVENISTVKSVSFDEKKVVIEKEGTYGTGKIDTANGTLTYTLTKPLDTKIPIPVYIKFNNSSDDTPATVRSVYIIPATSVYYEDSFATFTNSDKSEGVTINTANGNWTKVGETTDATQALEALGSKTNVYGYDSAYDTCNTYSMGSATKVTVDSTMAKNANVTWPTASFTFTGTGFDIISLTDNTSGEFFVDVYDEDGNIVKSFGVNNYYGYKQVDGKWVVDADSTDCLYQIPVMKVSGLTYGKYTAKISVEYDEFFDVAGKSQYSFWLDAIRVYNPMGKDVATYTQDNEGYPQYIKLHDELVKTTSESTSASSIVDTKTNKVFFIDGAEAAEVATYANYGPNNEVYLAKGQAITFAVASNDKIASIQIGAKAPSGTRKTANLVVNNTNVQTLSTATEMYYDITTYAKNGEQVTISNNGDGILSLTNLKITYSTKPTEDTSTSSDSDASPAMLTALSDEEVNTAVMSVRALFAAPVVETFEPATFEASWNSVRKGQTATLTVKTSEDVESIMVDGVAVTDYNTRTERNGFGWWADKVTYRVFTYQVTADETKDYTITAFNDAGAESEPITETLTVKESGSSWWSNLWNNFFDRWF